MRGAHTCTTSLHSVVDVLSPKGAAFGHSEVSLCTYVCTFVCTCACTKVSTYVCTYGLYIGVHTYAHTDAHVLVRLKPSHAFIEILSAKAAAVRAGLNAWNERTQILRLYYNRRFAYKLRRSANLCEGSCIDALAHRLARGPRHDPLRLSVLAVRLLYNTTLPSPDGKRQPSNDRDGAGSWRSGLYCATEGMPPVPCLLPQAVRRRNEPKRCRVTKSSRISLLQHHRANEVCGRPQRPLIISRAARKPGRAHASAASAKGMLPRCRMNPR